ncbi:hypothetical protein KEJ45_02135 [Candidatus Bathyarchaeota archaeon]|nr:hypothetical protein [Candidatus Bathyarchaeota archaeon]
MSTQKAPKGLAPRWANLKGLTTILIFIIISALLEYVIVIYAISLGVKDENPLQWSFQFPGTDWTATIAVSPLFHLVPITVIIALVFSWICLSKYLATRPREKMSAQKKSQPSKGVSGAVGSFFGKLKLKLFKVKGVEYLRNKTTTARVTVKSALTIFLVFSALTLLFSVLAFPELVYQTFVNLYQSNPSLLEFVKATNSATKGLVEALAPIGWVCTAIYNALAASASGLRWFVSALGSVTKPLAESSPASKYLAFQNIAVWISAFSVLFYGMLTRKSYRHIRAKRS